MNECYADNSLLIGRFFLTSKENVVFGIVYSFVAALTILVNITLIVSLMKTRQVNKKSNVLILILSISDLVTGGICLPFTVTMFIKYPFKRHCILETIHQATEVFFLHLSAYMTVTIAVDRYVNINPNLRNSGCGLRRIFSSSKIWLPLMITLGITSVTTAVHTITYVFAKEIHNIVVIAILSLDLFMFLTVFILYLRFYFKIWQFTRASGLYSAGTPGNHASSSPRYVDELGFTIFLILLIITICYIPFLFITTYQVVRHHTNPASFTHTDYLLSRIFFGFLYLNFGLNADIILFKNRELRNYVLLRLFFDCLVCKWSNAVESTNCDQRSENQNMLSQNSTKKTGDTGV